ncbi:MAG: S8 family peptidase [Caldilineaceae bacterium]
MSVKQRHAQILITLLLAMNAFGSLPAYPLSMAKLHSLLAQSITESPEQLLEVIVQKTDSSDRAEQLVAQLGGEVTKDLYFIHGFAARMKASTLPRLAAAPFVRWVSLDAPTRQTACTAECMSTDNLKNDYVRAVRADRVWNEPSYLQGQGIGVAVVDSGIMSYHPDLSSRIVAQMNVVTTLSTNDFFGHGTYVAGIIAGDGKSSNGKYIGIAPKANLINVKVSNVTGSARESDVIAGLQWIYENHVKYNIRVVNISINSAAAQSYHTSPLDAACEILWFNGMVVVVSSGNQGEGAINPPANDPFVITVGATDPAETSTLEDDDTASFSAFGVTSDGVRKPDLVAPGRHLVSLYAGTISNFGLLHPKNVVNNSYFMMSGTSAAAPVVSGAVALLLQDEPKLTPDQVKYRLMKTANKGWSRYDPARDGAGILNIKAAISNTSIDSANTGINVSNLLTTGPQGVMSPSVSWSSTAWNSVSWSSVSWSSVSWSSVSWSSVTWNSDYWESDGVLTTVKRMRSLSLDSNDTPEELEDESMGTKQVYLPIVVLH